MKVDVIRLPKDFTMYENDGLFSNLTNEINHDVAEYIKHQPHWAMFTAWDYFGKVWWEEKFGYWCVEIWQNKTFRYTHVNHDIADLVREIKELYGNR